MKPNETANKSQLKVVIILLSIILLMIVSVGLWAVLRPEISSWALSQCSKKYEDELKTGRQALGIDPGKPETIDQSIQDQSLDYAASIHMNQCIAKSSWLSAGYGN